MDREVKGTEYFKKKKNYIYMLPNRSSLSKVLEISFEFSPKDVVDNLCEIFSEKWLGSINEKYNQTISLYSLFITVLTPHEWVFLPH